MQIVVGIRKCIISLIQKVKWPKAFGSIVIVATRTTCSSALIQVVMVITVHRIPSECRLTMPN